MAKFEKKGKKPIDFKMPKWMECVWRRVPCNKLSCKICGRILRDRQRHIDRGENPDDWKSVFEDVGRNLQEAMVMIKKDAERLGIDITNINDIQEPPEPDEFPLYQEAKKWNADVLAVLQDAEQTESLWCHTEAAADMSWYVHTLLAKTYRQLCNRWHIEQNDGYGEFDYQYTKYVLRECGKIIKQSLAEAASSFSEQKVSLMILLTEFMELEKKIFRI